jgi:hypothetical protein
MIRLSVTSGGGIFERGRITPVCPTLFDIQFELGEQVDATRMTAGVTAHAGGTDEDLRPEPLTSRKYHRLTDQRNATSGVTTT